MTVTEEQVREAWSQLINSQELEKADPSSTYKSCREKASDTAKTVVAEDLPDSLVPNDKTEVAGASSSLPRKPENEDSKAVFDFDATLHLMTLRSRGKEADEVAVMPKGTKSFELGEVIGKGGMGVVYKAKQRSLQRDIAVKKILKNSNEPEAEEDFISEALVTGFLDHPNIVPVHDLLLTDDSDLVMSMKLVGGRSWKDIIRDQEGKPRPKSKRLSDDDLDRDLAILMQVAHAVAFAHNRGIVHCDLKPENVMIGNFGEVLVMDWGVAVDIRERADLADAPLRAIHKSEIDMPRGTPAYMPPELAEGRGADLSEKTDVYLLGSILYEVIRGRPPHGGHNFVQVLCSAIESRAPELPDWVPLELKSICTKAMAKLPEHRYQNVKEFQAALEHYRNHRESTEVENRADQLLQQCETVVEQSRARESGLSARERNQLYADFSESVSGFRQACLLWDGNHSAKAGEHRAHLAFAKFALEQGDLALAEAQTQRFSASRADGESLRADIARARLLRESKARSARRLSYAFAGALLALFGGLVFWVYDKHQNEQLLRRKNNEIAAQKKQAELAREEAQKKAQKLSKLLRQFTTDVRIHFQDLAGARVHEFRQRLAETAVNALNEDKDLLEGSLKSVTMSGAKLEVALLQEQIGRHDLAMRSLKEAEDFWRQADQAWQETPEAVICMAQILHARARLDLKGHLLPARVENLKQAEQWVGRYLKLKPGFESEFEYVLPILVTRQRIGGKAVSLAQAEKDLYLAGRITKEYLKAHPENFAALLERARVMRMAANLRNKQGRVQFARRYADQGYQLLLALTRIYGSSNDADFLCVRLFLEWAHSEEATGNYKSAVKFGTDALNITKELEKVDPHNAELMKLRLEAHHNLAYLFMYQEQYQRSLEIIAQGLSFARSALNIIPDSGRMRTLKASLLATRGNCYIGLKQYQEGMESISKATAEFEDMLKTNSGTVNTKLNLGLMLVNLADLQKALKQFDQTEKSVTRALEILRELRKKSPKRIKIIRVLVQAYFIRADLHRRKSESDDEAVCCEKAVQHAISLIQIDPTNSKARNMVSIVLYRVASRVATTGRFNDAVLLMRQALSTIYAQKSDSVETKKNLAIFERAMADMARRAGIDPEQAFEAARKEAEQEKLRIKKFMDLVKEENSKKQKVVSIDLEKHLKD